MQHRRQDDWNNAVEAGLSGLASLQIGLEEFEEAYSQLSGIADELRDRWKNYGNGKDQLRRFDVEYIYEYVIKLQNVRTVIDQGRDILRVAKKTKLPIGYGRDPG